MCCIIPNPCCCLNGRILENGAEGRANSLPLCAVAIAATAIVLFIIGVIGLSGNPEVGTITGGALVGFSIPVLALIAFSVISCCIAKCRQNQPEHHRNAPAQAGAHHLPHQAIPHHAHADWVDPALYNGLPGEAAFDHAAPVVPHEIAAPLPAPAQVPAPQAQIEGVPFVPVPAQPLEQPHPWGPGYRLDA